MWNAPRRNALIHVMCLFSSQAKLRRIRPISRCAECRLGVVLRLANVNHHLIPRPVLLIRSHAARLSGNSTFTTVTRYERRTGLMTDVEACGKADVPQFQNRHSFAQRSIGNFSAWPRHGCSRWANLFRIPDNDAAHIGANESLRMDMIITGHICAEKDVSPSGLECMVQVESARRHIL